MGWPSSAHSAPNHSVSPASSVLRQHSVGRDDQQASWSVANAAGVEVPADNRGYSNKNATPQPTPAAAGARFETPGKEFGSDSVEDSPRSTEDLNPDAVFQASQRLKGMIVGPSSNPSPDRKPAWSSSEAQRASKGSVFGQSSRVAGTGTVASVRSIASQFESKPQNVEAPMGGFLDSLKANKSEVSSSRLLELKNRFGGGQ